MSLRRVIRSSVVALLTAGVLSAPVEASDYTIGMSSRTFNPGFSNSWIGIPLGLYDAGFTPDVIGTQGESENLQAMLAGKITMSTGTQDSILRAAAEGRVLPVITPCLYLRGILFRTSVVPGSPIKTYADLGGKRIGVPSLANGGVGFIKYALQSAGVSPDSINILAVGDGQQAAAALTSGRIDALTNADVDVAQMQRLGVPLRVLELPEGLKNAAAGYAYVFNRPWFEANKRAALALVKGLIRSVIVMTANPEAAVRISYYMHPESMPSGISKEQAIKNAVGIIETRKPIIQHTSPVSDKWCEFPPAAWAKLADMLGIKAKIDPAQFYTDEFIASVNKINEPALVAWAKTLRVPDNDADIAVWLKTVHPPIEDVK